MIVKWYWATFLIIRNLSLASDNCQEKYSYKHNCTSVGVVNIYPRHFCYPTLSAKIIKKIPKNVMSHPILSVNIMKILWCPAAAHDTIIFIMCNLISHTFLQANKTYIYYRSHLISTIFFSPWHEFDLIKMHMNRNEKSFLQQLIQIFLLSTTIHLVERLCTEVS